MTDILDITKNTIINLFDNSNKSIKIYEDKYINMLLGTTPLYSNVNIYMLWNLDRKHIQKNINYLNLLFPNEINENIVNIPQCIYNINYTLEWFIKYLGWELIDNNVYRLDNVHIDWLNTSHYLLIDNMFNFYNINKLYNCSNILFLTLCKTSSNYLQKSVNSSFESNKIPILIFKKWLNYQSFWLNVNDYNINKLKKNDDIRLFVTKNSGNYKTIIDKGTPEDRFKILELYYNTFILNLPNNNISLNSFVDIIENLPIESRTSEMYNIYLQQKLL